MSTPPSERNDDYTAVNRAYQPAEPWSSPSPQVNDRQFALTPSEARDPMLGGQTIAYQPREMAASNTQFQARQNTSATQANRAGPISGGFHGATSSARQKTTPLGPFSGAGDALGTILGPLGDSAKQTLSGVLNTDPAANRDAIGRVVENIRDTDPAANRDALGRVLGLEPDPSKDPDNADMANQIARNLNDLAGDTLGALWENQKAGAGKLLSHLPQAVMDVEKFGAGALYNATLRPLTWAAGKLDGDPSDLGPLGWTPRQLQSNLDPVADTVGRLVSEKIIDFGPDSSAGDFAQEAADQAGKWWQDNPPESWPSTALRDIVRRGEEHPEAATAFEGGLQTLSDLVASIDTTIDAKAPPLRTAVNRQAQTARGAALGSAARGNGLLDRARDAVQSVQGIERPAFQMPDIHLNADYLLRSPDEVVTPEMRQRAAEAASAAKQWAAGIGTPDINLPPIDVAGLVADYLPRSPDVDLPDINLPDVRMPGRDWLPAGAEERARDVLSQARGWIDGVDLPNDGLPEDVQGLRDAVTDLVRPSVRNGRAPITVRRSPDGQAIDPNAMYMPEAAPASFLDQARSAGSDVVQGIADRLPSSLPDVSLPNVDLPAMTMPKIGRPGRAERPQGGPGTGGRSAGVPSDPLQQVFTEQQSGATRSATQPEGTSVAQEAGANWIKDANGNYVGLVDPATGEFVMLPANASNAEKQKIVNSILATTAPSAAPGLATAAPASPATAAATSATTGSGNSGPTTSGSRSNGSGGGLAASGAPGGRTTRSSDDDAPLKLEDFIQDFDGDGTISKRDRMQGKQAFEQAKAARSKKRRGKTTSRKGEAQFPFNRQDSPIRKQVLGAIAESQGRA